MSHMVNFDFRADPLYFAYRRSSGANDRFKGVFHAHQGIEIMFIHAGSGTIVVDRKNYEMKSDMLCIFQPYQPHQLQLNLSHNVPFVRSIVQFEPAMFETYFERWPSLQAFFRNVHSNQLHSPCIYELGETSELVGLIRNMSQRLSGISMEERQEEISLFLVSLYRTLRSMLSKHIKQHIHTISRKSHQVENIIKWVEHNLTQPMRLEQIANELHLSPHYLSHMFKECTGGSISEYIAARKIQRAIFLLVTSDKSISQIGEDVGMTNSSYFCRFFKSRMDITPHQFRNKITRGNCNTD